MRVAVVGALCAFCLSAGAAGAQTAPGGLALPSAAPEPASVQITPLAPPPPALAFTRELGVRSVAISPDGRHALAVVSLDGDQTALRILSLDVPGILPVQVTRPEVHIQDAWFLKNGHIAVEVATPITDGQVRSWRRRLYFTDLAAEVWREPLDTEFRRGAIDRPREWYWQFAPVLLSALPTDPEWVVGMSTAPGEEGATFRYNLVTGGREWLNRGASTYGGALGGAQYSGQKADLQGEMRARREGKFDGGAVYDSIQLRLPGGGWDEHFREFARDRSPITVAAFDADPNIAWMVMRNGRDHLAVWRYDIAARQLAPEPTYVDPLFDVVDVVQHRGINEYGRVLGYVVRAERPRTVWTDPQLEDIDRHARAALRVERSPVQWTDFESRITDLVDMSATGVDTRIVNWSDNFRNVLIEKSGPGAPPEYYILTFISGRSGSVLRPYGDAPPIDRALLGAGSLTQYTTRDGAPLPVLVTRPNPNAYGPGPYPTIVMAHDGPQARDDVAWDRLGRSQFWASRGYAVVQP
ncbi:MAG TPA: hypothetical protein VGB49_00280, partial [Caulobacteraceae bacterium]